VGVRELPSALLRPLLAVAIAAAPAATVAALATIAPRTATAAAALLGLGGPALGRHRVVLHDLALEDPDLDADDAIGCLREAIAEVDIGTRPS
jgi:hypothetical protein